MNTFREIEGLSNENLASGVLRLLLLRSVLVREKLVSLISRHSPVGPVASFSHFSCYTEYPTKDEDHGGGRIDLVLELDDAVVGIESKFFAGFQANQPEKYARSIEALANTLSRARDREPRSFVVVLVPQSLRHTAMGVVQPLERAAVLTWDEVESVLQDLLERSATLSPDDAFLVREFASYLKGKLSLLADYDAWVPHLRRSFESGSCETKDETQQSLSSQPRILSTCRLVPARRWSWRTRNSSAPKSSSTLG